MGVASPFLCVYSYFFLFSIRWNNEMSTEPRIPALSEASRTEILPEERSISVVSGGSSPKESVSTKMAMVKPIPPRQATAKSIFQEAPSGMAPTLLLMAIKEARVMPMGLPSKRPKKMPMPTKPTSSRGSAWNMLKKLTSGMTTPALANAKMGMMRKLTQGLRACSKR